MPQLTAPDVRFHDSFREAIREFVADPAFMGRTLTRELATYGDSWHDPGVFAAYTASLAEAAGDVTTLWWTEGDTFVGRLVIRRHSTPLGGHIGYGVRPSARRRGHATAILGAALPYAHDLGIDSVLVTCQVDNTASRKVIEACGGVFEDEREGRLRYWIRTAA